MKLEQKKAFKELLNAIEGILQGLLGGYSNGKIFEHFRGERGNSQSKWFLSGVGQPPFWPPPFWKSSKNKHSLLFAWGTYVRKMFSKGKSQPVTPNSSAGKKHTKFLHLNWGHSVGGEVAIICSGTELIHLSMSFAKWIGWPWWISSLESVAQGSLNNTI